MNYRIHKNLLERGRNQLEPNGTSLCMEELGDGFSFVFVFLVFLDVVGPMSYELDVVNLFGRSFVVYL